MQGESVRHRLWQMLQAGRWREVLNVAPRMLEQQLSPTDRAYASLILAHVYAEHCTDHREYREGLRYARQAREFSPRGTRYHLWALRAETGFLVDLGRYREAVMPIRAFFEAVGDEGGEHPVKAYMYRDLGKVHFAMGFPLLALSLFQRSMGLTQDAAFHEMTRCLMAWAFSTMGHPNAALQILPQNALYISQGHVEAAEAYAYATMGRNGMAEKKALAALRRQENGEWMTWDTIQEAKVCVILQQATGNRGRRPLFWLQKANEVLEDWNPTVFVDGLDDGASILKGGESQHVQSTPRSSCSSDGISRCGLRGTLG